MPKMVKLWGKSYFFPIEGKWKSRQYFIYLRLLWLSIQFLSLETSERVLYDLAPSQNAVVWSDHVKNASETHERESLWALGFVLSAWVMGGGGWVLG